jgi:anti-sigma28 factor (negative regulator of flagellin synthesis)
MKIENNGITPLSANRPEVANRVEKKSNLKNANPVAGGQDIAEMSENARLLAKARVALGNVEETDLERLALLKRQIESGDYTVQVRDLARKLVAKLYPK